LFLVVINQFEADSSNPFLEAILLLYLVALRAINPFHRKKAIKCVRKPKMPRQMVKTLKFSSFNFVLEGIKCFDILRLQELGVGLDGFSILVLGVFSLVCFLLSVLL
jgi:hypothetical protein